MHEEKIIFTIEQDKLSQIELLDPLIFVEVNEKPIHMANLQIEV